MQTETDGFLSPQEQANALLIEGQDYLQNSQFAQAQDCLARGLALCRQCQAPALEADLLTRLGTTHYSLAEYPAALASHRQAQFCLQELDDPARNAAAANGVGIVSFCLGDYGQALASYAECLALRRTLADQNALGRALNNIGGVYFEVGDYAGALHHYKECLTISRAMENPRLEAFCLGNIAQTYSGLERHDDALEAGREAVEAARRAGSPHHECRVLLNWGDALTKSGQPAEAQPLYCQALTLAQSLPDPNSECTVLSALGTAALAMKNLTDAHEYLAQAAEMAETLGLKQFAFQAHLGLSQVCQQQKNFESALAHYQRYHTLEREVFSEEKEKRTAGLMIQMDVERSQREAEIHRLRNVELAGANHALADANRTLQQQSELLEAQAEELRAQNEELVSQSEALARQAAEDGLTGLANRRYLENWLALNFYQARQDARPLTVAMADVDHFKQVNDRFGHQIGDEVLMTVAELFRQNCRASDLAARYGGEEFVLALPDTDTAQAFVLCERLRAAVQARPWTDIHPALSVTLSMGLSDDLDADSHERLLGLADAQLYEAKHAGRNRVYPVASAQTPA